MKPEMKSQPIKLILKVIWIKNFFIYFRYLAITIKRTLDRYDSARSCSGIWGQAAPLAVSTKF